MIIRATQQWTYDYQNYKPMDIWLLDTQKHWICDYMDYKNNGCAIIKATKITGMQLLKLQK